MSVITPANLAAAINSLYGQLNNPGDVLVSVSGANLVVDADAAGEGFIVILKAAQNANPTLTAPTTVSLGQLDVQVLVGTANHCGLALATLPNQALRTKIVLEQFDVPVGVLVLYDPVIDGVEAVVAAMNNYIYSPGGPAGPVGALINADSTVSLQYADDVTQSPGDTIPPAQNRVFSGRTDFLRRLGIIIKEPAGPSGATLSFHIANEDPEDLVVDFTAPFNTYVSMFMFGWFLAFPDFTEDNYLWAELSSVGAAAMAISVA